MSPSQEAISDSTGGGSSFVTKLCDAVAALRWPIREKYDDCFKYDDLKEGEIRLLRILPGTGTDMLRCCILRASIEKPSNFKTLSYTWDDSPGDDIRKVVPTEKIFLNHRPYLIAPNLLSALRYYRENYAEPLWVDFICINQLNLAERGKQVCYMRRIYESASMVLIWLGDEADDSAITIDFLERVSEERDIAASAAYIGRTMLSGDNAKRWKSLDHFWKRRYWTRTWIMQEQAVSERIDMACGRRRLQWKVLYRFVDAFEYAYSSGEMDAYMDMLGKEGITLRVKVIKHLWTLRYLRERSARGRPVCLLDALDSTRRALASDDRDKIYGILGFVQDASILVPRPEYTCSVQSVFISLVLAYIHHYKKLDILAHLSTLRKLANLPSWTPDWSITSRRPRLNQPQGRFCAAGHTVAAVRASSDAKVLVCEGICIDTLDGLGHSLSHQFGNTQHCHPDNAISIYGDDEATFSAMWRSLTCDTNPLDISSTKRSPKVMGRVLALMCRNWEDVFLKDHPQ
jgi:Heterokaryon incompatibility protein (HET)